MGGPYGWVTILVGGKYMWVDRTIGCVQTGRPYKRGGHTDVWAVPVGGPYRRVDRTDGWAVQIGVTYWRVGRTGWWALKTIIADHHSLVIHSPLKWAVQVGEPSRQ